MTDSDDEMNRRRCCRRTNSSGCCGKDRDIFSMMQFPGKECAMYSTYMRRTIVM